MSKIVLTHVDQLGTRPARPGITPCMQAICAVVYTVHSTQHHSIYSTALLNTCIFYHRYSLRNFPSVCSPTSLPDPTVQNFIAKFNRQKVHESCRRIPLIFESQRLHNSRAVNFRFMRYAPVAAQNKISIGHLSMCQ